MLFENNINSIKYTYNNPSHIILATITASLRLNTEINTEILGDNMEINKYILGFKYLKNKYSKSDNSGFDIDDQEYNILKQDLKIKV